MSGLRVGINFGNAVLAHRDAGGMPAGIAVDLAKELARRLSVPLELVTYEAAGQMAAGARTNAWDVAFLATDPDRAEQITFTSPYLEIDSTYLVLENSPLRAIEEVDREGIRIAVSDKSAYDLFLTRNLKRAQLVRAPDPNSSAELFFRDRLDALAGIRPMLLEIALKQPGTRVLDGRFTVVRQAVGTPAGHDAAAYNLPEFVADIKADGFLEQTIRKNGVRGLSVSPAPAQER